MPPTGDDVEDAHGRGGRQLIEFLQQSAKAQKAGQLEQPKRAEVAFGTRGIAARIMQGRTTRRRRGMALHTMRGHTTAFGL